LQIESTPKHHHHRLSPLEIVQLEARIETLWKNHRGPQEYAEIARINFALKRFHLAEIAVDNAETLLAGESLEPIYQVILMRAKYYARHHLFQEAKDDLDKLLPLRGIKHELEIFELSQKVNEKLLLKNPPIIIPRGCSGEKGDSLQRLQRREDQEGKFSALYEQATALIDESKYEEAKALLTKLIHEEVKLEFSLFSRAIVNYQLGLYELAQRDILESEWYGYPIKESVSLVKLSLEIALERKKAVDFAYKTLVACNQYRVTPKFIIDDLQQAKVLLDQVVMHDGRSLYHRALVNYRLGNFKLGLDDIEQAIPLLIKEKESRGINPEILEKEMRVYWQSREAICKSLNSLKT